jgi:capsular polysaccharide biosynthesis protein
MTLHELLLLLKKNLVLLVTVTLLCGALMLSITAFAIQPTYTATAKLYVQSGEQGSQNYSDLNYSRMLVETYLIIFRSETVTKKAATALQERYSSLTDEDIRDMFSGKQLNGTEAFSISITAHDGQLAADVCDALIAAAPDELSRIVKASALEVIDPARVPTEAYHPILRNTLLGLITGAAVSFCFALLRYTLKREKEAAAA